MSFILARWNGRRAKTLELLGLIGEITCPTQIALSFETRRAPVASRSTRFGLAHFIN